MAPPSKPNKGQGASDEAVTSDIRRGLFVFSAANSGRMVRRKPSPSERGNSGRCPQALKILLTSDWQLSRFLVEGNFLKLIGES
jgi:hypothetical protein